MKKKIILLLVLLLLFGLFIAGRFFFLHSQNTFGRVRVLSTPSAMVFINNESKGKTPYEEQLKAGDYTIKLIPEGEGTQAAPWQDKVNVYKNAMTYINRDLSASDVMSAGEVLSMTKAENSSLVSNTGELNVESEPSGAIVYLDNDEKGVSPLLLQDIPKGDHELSLFMPGFYRRTLKINIESSYRVNAKIKLALDQTHKTLEQTVEEKRKEASAEALLTGSPTPINKVKILDTSTGFLRVRAKPTLGGDEVTQVKPGEEYELLEEATGWFRIKIASQEGWVSAQFAKKESQ